MEHGKVGTYTNKGCRCDKCKTAATEYQRKRRAERAGLLAPDDPRHGKYTTYVNYDCRCDECKLAWRALHLSKAYGVTPEQWDAMWSAQGECCAACGSDDPGSPKGWRVDHSHDTGEVRGILCHNCNVALGMVRDSVDRLEALIRYLG